MLTKHIVEQCLFLKQAWNMTRERSDRCLLERTSSSARIYRAHFRVVLVTPSKTSSLVRFDVALANKISSAPQECANYDEAITRAHSDVIARKTRLVKKIGYHERCTRRRSAAPAVVDSPL